MSGVLHHSALDSQLEPLADAPHWYVGFSGGLDSTVLLHLLQRWCRSNPGAPALSAIHINHGLQEQADDWQVHCEWVCKFLHAPCISHRVQVETGGRGLEAAARSARYQAFETELGAGDILFLAHHLDDQIETFFLRLLRGAGVQGLAAMPRERQLGEGRLVRPLLQTGRESLQAYAREQGLEVIEDPSNRDSSLDRNYLRREILPRFAERWPAYRETVSRASNHLARVAQGLAEELELPPTRFSIIGDPGFEASALDGSGPEYSAAMLRAWLRLGGYPAPDQVTLLEFLRQLREAGSQASPRLQCRNYALQRYRDIIYLQFPDSAQEAAPEFVTLCPGGRCEIPGVGAVSLQPASGAGLALQADEELQLRFRQGGERCRPVGRNAGNSLKKLLQEWAVPHWWRDRVPLLYAGEELLAVGQLWSCDSSRWRAQADTDQGLWQLCWEPLLPGGFD